MKTLKRYLLYLLRWQCSTPILAVAIWLLRPFGDLISSIVANFVGGLIFFWIDRLIFKKTYPLPLWEIRGPADGSFADGSFATDSLADGSPTNSSFETCGECGEKCDTLYRLVSWGEIGYDRQENTPVYRCKSCRDRKFKEIKEKSKG